MVIVRISFPCFFHNFIVRFAVIFSEGSFMDQIIGITNARNNIKEIIDTISDKDETYIVTRDSAPEAVIISYKKYIENKMLLNQMNELIYEKSVKKSRLQFKEWLTQKGYDIEKLSEEEIGDMIKNLQVNNSF